ncbi:hypothetical protein PoB_005431200 [Plakobranchus ocellatus]|uniref:HSF-type DNA-binding domain-containing protein n=1 Tax=Plakobranchus ocellatus TaxID=259542 RepID=A0AAV4C8F1_9GAST|nr:hypothetical protein PoB_005431200 [Plakobranchus ocellatus]
MGVCALHWPKDAPMVRAPRSRHCIPAVPPSIFPNVPQSCIPTSTQTTPRPTKKATKDARAVDVDEMGDFLEQDTIKLATFNDLLLNKLQSHGFVARGTSLDTSNKYVFFSYERKGTFPNF